MMKYRVHIKSKNRNNAIIEGAKKLGVASSLVQVSEEDHENFIICLVNSPGEFELEARDDKMVVILRSITPPTGTGTFVAAEDIQKALSDLKIKYGIDKDIINSTVKEVKETGKTRKNIAIAKGLSPQKGEKAKIELKIGRDALNRDPKASSVVKPGQIVAVKIPATSGIMGRDIFGEDVPPVPGDDVDFLPGENVIIKENNYISEVYGAARGTWQGISVTDYVKVSKDRMYVEMSLFPVLADNSRLSFEDIADILKNKGIKYGVNSESIQTALEKGEPAENFRIAEAIPAKDGIDAKIKYEFKINGIDPEEANKKRTENDSSNESAPFHRDLVLGGEFLARKIPAIKQEDGRSVTGDVLKGRKPNDRKVKAGHNVDTLENGQVYVVAEDIIAGYADYSEDTISVENPLFVSEDKLSASITIYPPSSKKRFLTHELVKEIINRAGIKYGVERHEIENISLSVKEKKHVIVAKGKAPVNGEDAVIDLKFDRNKNAGALISGTDRMDFREQAFIHNVKKGDVLAQKIPLKTGTDGKNIFGEKIPASPGKDKKLIPGTNVLVSDDGLIADIDGMVLISEENKISVLKSHEVSGDIDMHTGNLTMDGSLVIKGWVCSGFVVRASGEVHIGRGVEQATIDAGAGLYIHGGIIGADKENIVSGGKIAAFFIENAKVHAKHDIIVRDDIRNSSVTTSGNIDVTGRKGRIIGGSTTAYRDIKANETGSPGGVRTKIIIGVDPETSRRMDKISVKLEEFKRQRAKIDMYLVRFSNKRKLSDLPKSIRFRLDKLIKQRRDIVKMEAKLVKYKEKLQKKERSDNHPPSLTVNKIVYAGTVIKIEDAVLEIKEDIPGRVKFFLNNKNEVIYK